MSCSQERPSIGRSGIQINAGTNNKKLVPVWQVEAFGVGQLKRAEGFVSFHRRIIVVILDIATSRGGCIYEPSYDFDAIAIFEVQRDPALSGWIGSVKEQRNRRCS